MAAGSRPWLEITLEAQGDVISAAGRSGTGDTSAARALGPGLTVTALRQLQAELGAAVQERRPLGPALIEKTQALHRTLFQGKLRELLEHQRATAGDRPLLVVLDPRAALLPADPGEQTNEDREFIMSTQDALGMWEQQVLQRGIDQGIEKGRLAGERAALRWVLARRQLVLGASDEARIEACSDVATLERWLDQALTAATIAEALS